MMLRGSRECGSPSRCPTSCIARARIAAPLTMRPSAWCTASSTAASTTRPVPSRTRRDSPVVDAPNCATHVTRTAASAESSVNANVAWGTMPLQAAKARSAWRASSARQSRTRDAGWIHTKIGPGMGRAAATVRASAKTAKRSTN